MYYSHTSVQKDVLRKSDLGEKKQFPVEFILSIFNCKCKHRSLKKIIEVSAESSLKKTIRKKGLLINLPVCTHSVLDRWEECVWLKDCFDFLIFFLYNMTLKWPDQFNENGSFIKSQITHETVNVTAVTFFYTQKRAYVRERKSSWNVFCIVLD